MSDLHELYAEYDAIWGEMVAENERGWATGAKSGQISPEGEKIRERLEVARVKLAQHGERDMEPVLLEVLGPLMEDHAFATDVYRALSNVGWRHDDGSRYECSWRHAGALVAESRNQGEDYMGFYCSGGEGRIDERIADLLAARGWRGTSL